MTRTAAGAALGLAISAACGCGGGLANVTVIAGDVSVDIEPDRLPFDPHAARLVAAARKLTGVAGHPIALRIDTALVPEASRSSLEDTLTDAIETIADDLSDLRKSRPDVFAAEVPRLARVELRYDAVVEDDFFDGAAVVIREPAGGGGRLVGDDVSSALDEDYGTAQERRFGGRDPASIAPADRRAYFEYLVRYAGRPPRHGPDGKPLPRRGPIDTWPATMQRVVTFASVVGGADPDLARDVRDYLLDAATMLSNCSKADDGSNKTCHSTFYVGTDVAGAARAQAMWIAWLKGALPGFGPKEKQRVAEALFTTPWGSRDPAQPAYPGFDVFAFGLSLADDWISAGHPAQGTDPGFEMMVRWVRQAVADEATTQRLADALGTRAADPLLLRAVVATAGESIPLLRDLEAYPRLWRDAVLQIIPMEWHRDREGERCSDELLTEANRMWRSTPDVRGTVLHVFACHHAIGNVAWSYSDGDFAGFAQLYGEPVSAAIFGQFLDDGTSSMELVPWVWLALGKGWSRADVLGRKLGPYMTDPSIRSGGDGEPERTLEAIAKRMCEDKSVDEIARLRAALVARGRADATESRLLSNVLADMEPGRCSAKR